MVMDVVLLSLPSISKFAPKLSPILSKPFDLLTPASKHSKSYVTVTIITCFTFPLTDKYIMLVVSIELDTLFIIFPSHFIHSVGFLDSIIRRNSGPLGTSL